MLTKNELRDNLKKMQKKLCVYKGRCKCHYGADNPGGSQQGSGCPETREVIDLLERMTEKEYAYISKRRPKVADNALLLANKGTPSSNGC
jgi:hypothetical protein